MRLEPAVPRLESITLPLSHCAEGASYFALYHKQYTRIFMHTHLDSLLTCIITTIVITIVMILFLLVLLKFVGFTIITYITVNIRY